MRHFRMTGRLALVSVALVATLTSCSRPSDPEVMEPPPVQQAELPPVGVEPDDGYVPVEVDSKKWIQSKIDAHKASQPAEPGIGKPGEQKPAIGHDVPIAPPAKPPGRKPPVPMRNAAAAAVPSAVDYSLVHVAPIDVAVLVIRPVQILENPKLIELSTHLKAMGREYDPTRAWKLSEPGSLEYGLNSLVRFPFFLIPIATDPTVPRGAVKSLHQIPLPPLESIQISWTHEGVNWSLAEERSLENAPTVLIQLRQAFDHEAFFRQMIASPPQFLLNNAVVEQHRETQLLMFTPNWCICFLDRKTVLSGTKSAVVRAIDRQGKPEASPLLDRIARLTRKDFAFVRADLGEAERNRPIGHSAIPFTQATSELFVDLRGDVVYHYREHNHGRVDADFCDPEDVKGQSFFVDIFTRLTEGQLGLDDPVPQPPLTRGYTVDKAAFDTRWSRMNDKLRGKELATKQAADKLAAVQKAAAKQAAAQQVAVQRAMEQRKRDAAVQAHNAVIQTAKSLNEIVRAMRRYELRHKCFPAIDSAGLDKSPRGLSWRVHLLPELGFKELYAEFHLDEPWDSDHNKGLLAKIPPIYGADPAGKSAIHVFIGEGTPFGEKRSLKLAEIKDAPMDTAALVQAGPDKAEPWTKPGGLPWNRENPLAELGTIGVEVPVAFFDAGAGWFPASIPHETLSKMIGHTDGNPPREDVRKWRYIAPGRSDVKR
jgi:Protein of unknown function (DUF1559)